VKAHERAREIGIKLSKNEERQSAMQGLAEAVKLLITTIGDDGKPEHEDHKREVCPICVARAALERAKPFL
jgi:hypothetical protein